MSNRLKRKASAGVAEILASSNPKRSRAKTGKKPLVTKYSDDIVKLYNQGCSYEDIVLGLRALYGSSVDGITSAHVKGKINRMITKGFLKARPVGQTSVGTCLSFMMWGSF